MQREATKMQRDRTKMQVDATKMQREATVHSEYIPSLKTGNEATQAFRLYLLRGGSKE